MTDKQIIIDGVDVSGCEYFKNNGKCRIPHYQQNIKYTCCNCSEWNCYYKQLKRKEQECERWKKANDEKNELLAKLGCPTVATARRLAFTLQQQIDTLKEEKEKIKESRDYYKRIVDGCPEICENGFCLIDFYNKKLNKTLTEIKEVLQFYNNTTIGTDKGNGIFEFEVSNDTVSGGKLIYCYDTNPAKKALQKISEVLND